MLWIGREVFDALKAELEAALAIVNKCCAMRQFDKLIDQGSTKRFLTMIRENLFMRSREVSNSSPSTS
jgi:hypothetical protein